MECWSIGMMEAWERKMLDSGYGMLANPENREDG